jgi:hypothetical protein
VTLANKHTNRKKVLIRAETSMLYIEPCEEKLVLWVRATSVKSQFLARSQTTDPVRVQCPLVSTSPERPV